MAPFKSGFISILGRPNAGKSTLFNRIIGDKIAIVTETPQTTRNRILGIKNMEEAQLIFLDTPGIHSGKNELNRRMVRTAVSSAGEADVLLFTVEASRPMPEEDRRIIESVKASKGVRFLVFNKIDLVRKEKLLPLIDRYQGFFPFQAILPVSATTGEGIEILLDEILKVLPESPPYFPEEMITDQTERFLASEMIREKVIFHSYEEIPYASAVTIEEFKEHPERNLLVIKATIHVEKISQKKILIGRAGQKLKKIGEQARKEMEVFFGARVFLELWVNVEKGWTQNPNTLNRLGYLPPLSQTS